MGLLLLSLVPAASAAGSPTPGIAWGTATLLEANNTTSVSHMHVVAEDSGNVTVFFQQGSGNFLVRYDPTSGWQGVAGMPVGANCTSWEFTSNSKGTVAGLCTVYTGDPNRTQMVYTYTPSSGWDSGIFIFNDTGGSHHVVMAVGPDDEALVVWDAGQYNSMNQSLWARWHAASGAWLSPTQLYSGNVLAEAVAVESGGNATVIGRSSPDTTNNQADLNEWRYANGTAWGNATVIAHSPTGWGSPPTLAVHPNGLAVATWPFANATTHNWELFASYRGAAGAWGSPERLVSMIWTFGPVGLAINGTGHALASWREIIGGVECINVTLFSPSSGWTPQTPIESTVGDGPVATMDESGNALLFWANSTANGGELVAARYRPAYGWTAPAILDADDGEVQTPTVGINSQGGGAIAWRQAAGFIFSGWARPFDSDLVAPSLSVDSPAVQSVLKSSRVTVAGRTEPGATVTVNGSTTFVNATGAFARTLTLLDGVYSVPVVATDSAGNTAAISILFTVDTTPPNLTVDYPPSGALFNTTPLTVNGSTDPNSSVEVNGRAIVVAPNGSFSTTVPLAEGSNLIVVRSTDAVGNSAWRNLTVVLDSQPPPLSLDSPLQALTNQSLVRVAGTTEPGATVWLDFVPLTVSGPGAFAIDLNLSEGLHVLHLRATDAAQNAREILVEITVDTTPPALAVDAPSDLFRTTAPSVEVRGSAGVGASVTVNGLGLQVAGNGAFAALLALRPGPNTITVTAMDAAGNSLVITRTVTFDDPLPGLLADLEAALAQANLTAQELAALRLELNSTQGLLAQASTALEAQGTLLNASWASLNESQAALEAAMERLNRTSAALEAEQSRNNETREDLDAAVEDLAAARDDLNHTRSEAAAANASANSAHAAAEAAQGSATLGMGLGVAGLAAAVAVALLSQRRRGPSGPPG